MSLKAVSLHERLRGISKPWTPECLFTVDDSSYSFKIAKIEGAFVWHSHPNTDETFYCISGGPLNIELNDSAATAAEAETQGPTQVVTLNPGDLFVVPKSMQHRPVAISETGIMMVERVGTSNTGDNETSSRTVFVNE